MRMQLRMRTLMLAVGAAAIATALLLHVCAVIREEDDFAAAILTLEAIAATVLGGVALAIWGVARIVRRDADYAAHLRRRDALGHPFPLAETSATE